MKSINLLKDHEFFITENFGINDIHEIKNDYNSNPIKVWTFDITRIGKSAMIKYEAEQFNLNYIDFPIGGCFDRK